MSDCNGLNFTEARCKTLLYETSNHRDNSSRFGLALVQCLGGDTSCDNDPRGRGALPALNCVQFDRDNGGCGSSTCVDTPYAHVQDSDGKITCNVQATCANTAGTSRFCLALVEYLQLPMPHRVTLLKLIETVLKDTINEITPELALRLCQLATSEMTCKPEVI